MSHSQNPYTHDELNALGPQPVYTGEALRQIAFPLGGIGTGCVSLSGRGALVDWEIFNRPNKGSYLPYSFFSLWAQREGESPVTRVLEAPPQPPFDGSGHGNRPGLGHGVACDTGAGLPHMQGCTFRGECPFAWIEYADSQLPLEVRLEAYSPFIPLNPDDSSLPVALFRFTLHNSGPRPVQATLAGNLFNAVGYRGGRFDGSGLGGNVNTCFEEEGLRGLLLTSERYEPSDPHFGSLALTTPWPQVTRQSAWLRAGWFDALQSFWDEFSTRGALTERTYGPSDTGRSDVGTIGLQVHLAPGESKTLPLYISWCFPNFSKYWHQRPPGSESCCCGADGQPTWRNHYATRFQDALDVARYVAREEERLHGESLRFHDALHDSTLPPYVIDAVSSQASILKSTTCLRLTDGTFYAFEGCHAGSGCCEGSCTHVWNYAQTLAFLFPSLERSMRDADYTYNQFADGRMGFRLQLPLGCPPSQFHPAADGQMGGILKVYRDWKLSGDTGWLRGLWPQVRKALEYAWQVWDVDRDGVMEGIQHNTYDIEFWGPNTMMGTFYLGALRAAEEMALALGEEKAAREYRELFESGRTKMEAELYNGEYYEQRVDPNAHEVAPVDLSKSIGGQVAGDPKYQYGAGCLADHVIGQWFGHLVGLGCLLEPQHVREALASVFRYNWKPDLSEHTNCQRVFALNDEQGLLLCTWPRGGRPTFPFPYSDEVWCGIEYQVASHLIYEGLVDEGLSIVRGVRHRHDGVRRNPWNEFECGSHYARSLASWSVLTALSGFSFDLPRGAIGFAPHLDLAEFRVFWSVGSGWGTYRQLREGRRLQAQVRLAYGQLAVKELGIGGRSVLGVTGQVHATVAGNPVRACLAWDAPGATVSFEDTVDLQEGDELTVEIS